MPEETSNPIEDAQKINLQDLIPKDVYALVKQLIAVLGHNAWVYMGLQMNPLTSTTTKDLTQARLAIDCTAALIEQVQNFVDEAERQELKILIQNLQMNYIQQSGS